MGYDGLAAILEREKQRAIADAQRYKELDEDLCQLCHAYGADKRTLLMRCFYAIHESVPEAIQTQHIEDFPEPLRNMYYLRICKSCRGRLLGMLHGWRNECVALRGMPKDHDGHIEEEDPERNIPVRINGAIVYMTEAEYHSWRAAKEKPDA